MYDIENARTTSYAQRSSMKRVSPAISDWGALFLMLWSNTNSHFWPWFYRRRSYSHRNLPSRMLAQTSYLHVSQRGRVSSEIYLCLIVPHRLVTQPRTKASHLIPNSHFSTGRIIIFHGSHLYSGLRLQGFDYSEPTICAHGHQYKNFRPTCDIISGHGFIAADFLAAHFEFHTTSLKHSNFLKRR